MAKNQYNKGAGYERKLKREYEMKGWFVIRSAGSKGPADLIAINPKTRRIKVIQVKTYKKRLSEKEMNNLIEKIPTEEGAYILENEIL